MDWVLALTTGLIGSFHCIGMCGPIAIALPLNNQSWFSRIFGGSLYNMGRAITYALQGAIFGLLGKGLALGGLQQIVSIVLGAIMILSVVFPAIFRNRKGVDRIVSGYGNRLKKAFGKFFKMRSYGSLFMIGILNGFLPCGLVYIAIAGAIATGDIANGSLYMFIFGLGTLPVMLALSLVSNVVSAQFKQKINRIIPIFIVIIGILFILRGSNLGIKYISPKMDKKEPTKMECCH